MNKIIFHISIFLLLNACSNSASSIDKIEPKLGVTFFDVVEKQLIIKKTLPFHVQKQLLNWFDNKIKVDGLDGYMLFTILDYNENISNLSKGKRIDLSLKFKVLIKNNNLSQTKTINGEVTAYSTLTGDFNLNDFDNIIQNTQTDLIVRLSQDLKEKVNSSKMME
tara:strand:+ start:189 stop:683 length:495 start_codon:yes stop_codon:yes gene_type:complete